MKIIVDTREQLPLDFSRWPEVTTEIKTLSAGDYSLCGPGHIEGPRRTGCRPWIKSPIQTKRKEHIMAILRPNQPLPTLSRRPVVSQQRKAVTGRSQPVTMPGNPVPIRAGGSDPMPTRPQTAELALRPPQQSAAPVRAAQPAPAAPQPAQPATPVSPDGNQRYGGWGISDDTAGMNDVGAQQSAMEAAAQEPSGPPSGVRSMTKSPEAMAAAKQAATGAIRGGLKAATQVAGIQGAATGDLINAGVVGAGMGAAGGLVGYGINRGLGYIGNQYTNARSTARVNEAAEMTDFSQPGQQQALANVVAEEQARRTNAPNTLTGYARQGLMGLFSEAKTPAYQTTSATLNLDQEPSFSQDPVNQAAKSVEEALYGQQTYALGRRDPSMPTGRVTTPGAAFGNPGDGGISRGDFGFGIGGEGFGPAQQEADNPGFHGHAYGQTPGMYKGIPTSLTPITQTPKTKPQQSQPKGSISGSGRIGSQPGGGYGAGPSGSRFGIGGQGNNDIGASGRIGSRGIGGGYGGFGGFGGYGGGGGGVGGGSSNAGVGGSADTSESGGGGHGW